MARLVGDLSDPKNENERVRAAEQINRLATMILLREVRTISIHVDYGIAATYWRHDLPRPPMEPATVEIEFTRRGRHER